MWGGRVRWWAAGRPGIKKNEDILSVVEGCTRPRSWFDSAHHVWISEFGLLASMGNNPGPEPINLALLLFVRQVGLIEEIQQ